MSTIDRAFIRAYEIDEQVEPAPSLHVHERRHAPPAAPFADDATVAAASAPVASTSPAPHFRIYRSSSPAPPSASRSADAGQRRPLSSFGAPAPSVEARFRPSHEVDAYRWSRVVDELVHRYKTHWQAAVEALLAADDDGRSLIGVASAGRGVGTTTATACLARLLAESGKTVAIVDGDFADAALAASLGLVVEIGWEDVLSGRVPLAEAVVESIADRIALLPLVQGGVPAAEKVDGIQASVTAGVLRYHYNIVLFDLGDLSDEIQGPIARRIARQCRLDGALLLTGGSTAAAGARVLQTVEELAAVCLGVVENLVRSA